MYEDFQPAPLDLRAKLLTVFVVGLILVAARQSLLLLVVLVSVVLLVAAIFSIRGYRLTSEELLIQHVGWSQRWKLRELRHVNVRPGILSGSIRTIGIGGFFGYIGRFHSAILGDYQAYVTDGARAVVLTFNDDTVVVSPDDPAAFVSKVYQLRAG